MTSRLPLGEIPSSTFNKIKHNTNDKITHISNIPSVVSINNNLESPTNRILFNSLSSRLKKSKSSNKNDIKSLNNNRLKFSDTEIKDFTQLSHKLQIRLQFAYYKYKTKQINLKFADLKKIVNNNHLKVYERKDSHIVTINNDKNHNNIIKSNIFKGTDVSPHPKIKRRKLLVSHGQYKSPMKNFMPKKIQIDNTNSVINNAGNNNLLDKLNEKDDGDKDIDAVKPSEKTSITPIRHNKILKYNLSSINTSSNNGHMNKQETPMKVDAAKSLIDLFSSKNY